MFGCSCISACWGEEENTDLLLFLACEKANGHYAIVRSKKKMLSKAVSFIRYYFTIMMIVDKMCWFLFFLQYEKNYMLYLTLTNPIYNQFPDEQYFISLLVKLKVVFFLNLSLDLFKEMDVVEFDSQNVFKNPCFGKIGYMHALSWQS